MAADAAQQLACVAHTIAEINKMTMEPAAVSTGSFTRMFFLRSRGELGLGSRGLLLAVFGIAVSLAWPVLATGQDTSQAPQWVATWGTSPSTPGSFGEPGALSYTQLTLPTKA